MSALLKAAQQYDVSIPIDKSNDDLKFEDLNMSSRQSSVIKDKKQASLFRQQLKETKIKKDK
jgi:hypothetical protein